MGPSARGRRRKFLEELQARGEFHNGHAVTDLLYDRVTDLPTVPLLLGRIRNLLREARELGLLSISILQHEKVEQALGRHGYESLVRDIASYLMQVKQEALRREDQLAEVMISGNAFVVLLAPPRGSGQVSYPDIEKVRRRVADRLGRFVRDRLPPSVQERFGVYIGCAVLTQDPGTRFERRVYAALEEAFADSLRERTREHRRVGLLLKEVLKTGALQAVYQPVVDLVERRSIGYEALTRTTTGAFSGPDQLFKAAYDNDAVWKLERLCRERAILGVRGIPHDHLLFLNMEPDSIYDPSLRSEQIFDQLRAVRLKPTQVVLEITEHSAVQDHAAFRQMLNYFQFHGFRLAVDDVGSGYSGLKSIAELRPDFIKIDMALIRDIHLHPIKQDLTATINRFSCNSGTTLIAEGVEAVDELRCLQRIGVRYAQGYLFARPGPPFVKPDLDVIGPVAVPDP
ncbi:MAG TPA: EAL domain-containing protein [Candidatus Cryosericum sp.]|nr:EAL domain-containing protein [Candidatus Cryosericum sp.]